MDRIDPPGEPNREETRDESTHDSSANSAASSSGRYPPNLESKGLNSNGNGASSGVSSNGAPHTHGAGRECGDQRSTARVTTTVGTARPGPVCRVCPLRAGCRAICEVIEAILPSPERGRVDAEDIPRLFSGMRMVRALLDFAHILTERQQEVVRLYYRESLQQQEIATQLGITQQAVHDSLRRARKTIGERIVQGDRSTADVRPRPLDS